MSDQTSNAQLEEEARVAGRAEVRETARTIARRILEANDNLELLEMANQANQTRCDHPGVVTYRDHPTGRCETCLRDFMSKHDIDMIYIT
jgi:hypothetical protein